MSEILDTKKSESLEICGIGILETGLTVEHPSLGLGVVESIQQVVSSGDITIKVNFSEYGLKNINPKHAHLTIVKNPENNSLLKGLLKGIYAWW